MRSLTIPAKYLWLDQKSETHMFELKDIKQLNISNKQTNKQTNQMNLTSLGFHHVSAYGFPFYHQIYVYKDVFK